MWVLNYGSCLINFCKAELLMLPWYCPGLSELVSPLAIHALAIWDALNKQGQLASLISPLAPLEGGGVISPGSLWGNIPLLFQVLVCWWRDEMWQTYARSGFIATGYSRDPSLWMLDAIDGSHTLFAANPRPFLLLPQRPPFSSPISLPLWSLMLYRCCMECCSRWKAGESLST